ncbi:DUF1642 domain-containing protein [Streptococcus suis]|uniref:Phage protein n=1 Tax=Streptococcus suis TaxID=1307 RepID=A0AAN2RGI3_STRSU|nr:DUF1642 domain-containing protein [Streptococcus suis]NQH73531.1 DUF1642 domain-containing protein [Streptococcus suis]CYU74421.1 phage protein [Streptococcus suis]
MNKQEAIKRVEELYGYGSIAKTVTDIISQIHEPQKVVLPKFVAEWIEKCKDMNRSLRDAMKNTKLSAELNAWFLETGQDEFTYPNQETFARAWLDGYQVEQERLYTVEIPDPNRPDIATFLYKENGKVFIGTDIFLDEVPNYKWKNEPENQLTESEIKEDFEWAWQFREEVD